MSCFRLFFLAALVPLCLLPSTELLGSDLVDVKNLEALLVFQPYSSDADLVLQVAGPCNYQLRQTLADGPLVFRPDETTIDGAYSFEVSAVHELDAATRETLLEARASDDESQVDALCREGLLSPRRSTQSGGFLVEEGRIVYEPEAVESESFGRGPATKDQVIVNDLVVEGSTCLGLDCFNGENFGFDTLRLKENNLRIGFVDSSVGAFPSNDWELQANDTASGGANRFSIEDVTHGVTPFTVTADAPSHSLFVDAEGRIGGRTSTPARDVHTVTGDTPTLRLEQDASLGLPPQIWDLGGNEARLAFRDRTNGSRPFTLEAGAPTASLYVASGGNVGLGTQAPAEALHLRRQFPQTAVLIENSNPQGLAATLKLRNAQGEWRIKNTMNGWFALENGNFVAMRFDPVNLDARFFGSIITNGGGLCDPGPCDRTFVDYELESIEEHAEYMWQNQHLWGVGPTPEGEPIDLGRKVTGILHELEKAHLYIEQLNWEMQRLSAENLRLAERVDAMETGGESEALHAE